jgi:hypothetical protein
MENTIRTSVYLDGKSQAAAEQLPMSMSAVIRVLLVALVCTDRDFEKYVKENPKAKEIVIWLSSRLSKLVR